MFFMFFKPNIEKMKNKKDIKGLEKALKNKDVSIRVKAARALGEIGDDSVVDVLIRSLEDDSIDVKRSVVWALGKIGSTKAINALVDVLKNEEAGLKIEAAKALKEVSSKKASEVIQAISSAFNVSKDVSETLLKTGFTGIDGISKLSGLAKKILGK